MSLVSTVLNDKDGCDGFLRQMLLQSRRPDEIIIVDGGSKDGTWEWLQNAVSTTPVSLKVVQDRGCNIARGRNMAIRAAKHVVIVSTDIGCRWAVQWIEELIAPFEDDPSVEAVMGSWEIDIHNSSGWALIEAAVLPSVQFIAMPQSHASSRSIAYRKTLWDRIGGYPEDLTLAADDMVFALLLHRASRKTAAAPVPRVSWERPSSLRAFRNEARRNLAGAGEAGIWLKYGCLVGGRLALEMLGGAAGIAFLISGFWAIGVGFIVAALVPFILRADKLMPAVKRAQALGISDPLKKVLMFEYAIKLAGIRGYWSGMWRGASKCASCRRRLREAGIGWA